MQKGAGKVKFNIIRLLDKGLVTPLEQTMMARGIRVPWMPTHPMKNSISIVVPCYNLARYLEKFLRSIVSQTSDLRGLEVILVDDGSTDGTEQLAQSWVAKFPKLIRYHRQENQGLSATRNTGLSLATGDWISFPDPDDFFHHRYFETIDKFITKERHRNLSMVCCNFVRFFEKTGKKKDNHALKFRFQSGVKLARAHDLGNMMQLAINSAFLRRSDLLEMGLTFNPLIVPGFEDAEVVNRYLTRLPDSWVAFLPGARYYYVKRADESSMQDTARTKKSFYLNQPKYGWLSVLADAKEIRGEIPKFIQRTVLYDAIGHFRNHLKRPQALGILTAEEKEQYKRTMADAMAYLSPELVANTELPGLYEDLRVGILNLYFGESRDYTNAYITHYDDQKNLMRISMYTASDTVNPVIRSDGSEVHKSHLKIIRNTFVGDTFFYEIAFWVPVDPGRYTIELEEGAARFRAAGKSFNKGITATEILAKFGKRPKPVGIKALLAARFNDAWLLMDRTDKGDDNAEHFYRYLKAQNDGGKYYFVLNRNSPDWDRLKREGFDLIAFRSLRHLAALQRAKYLISSHADAYIRKPFPAAQLRDAKYKFLFIQHGVTKDNQSEWFNHVMPSLLATATTAEQASIVDPRSDYHLTNKEVFLTGFPRHDALLELSQSWKTIFIMPTWRENLSGTVIRPGVRALKPGFEDTEYVARWSALLNSEKLRDLAVKHQLRIVFCPHPNLAKHTDAFKLPPYVETVFVDRVQSLQPFFAEMAVMITDYSSVAFDAGILNRPVVYYQFDRDAFFSGHIYRTGYFDYVEHGFGPAVDKEEDVLESVSKAVSGKECEEYARRRLSTFPFRDGQSSSRLHHAILSLD
ncbi:glycosyltransferase [Ensifer adhaerens]|uniref:bifunctional glycosyltransferase/CDP-glycerol:glycerophosphate glycerophosphotransferase n=1 Tax=Ensifer canadensis TaxID=555315 RepID=UPI0014901400|nr:CDP-glycerol glycerophosphotransferase family protein [Ensifer canadensis]NOV15865.1 glycosyltransferase [Ensifer canadensis]